MAELLFVVPGFGPITGGTFVSLYGMGFPAGETIAVAFDGVPAPSVTYVSATEIQCVTPMGMTPGFANVALSFSGGLALELLSGFVLESVEVSLPETAILLTWVEFTDRESGVHVWSKVDLADALTYYRGFKESRVISWGRIARALSDRNGQFEATDFSWVLSDTDRQIRSLLDDTGTQYLKNRPVVVRMIDDDSRRKELTPRTVIRGYVSNYKPLSPLHFQFSAQDMLTSKFAGLGSSPAQVPQRIWVTDFPGSPFEVRTTVVPIIYGHVSDEASATGAVVIPDTHQPEGSWALAGNTVAGFGPMTSAAARPTGVNAYPIIGGALSADVPNSEYGVWVTAIDASGRESDPHIYYANGASDNRGSWALGPTPGIAVNGEMAIQVYWNASPGAVKYRAYLGYYYFGARWLQFIETTDLIVTFTQGPGWQDQGPITPGAQPANYALLLYGILAVMGDGLTAPSVDVSGISGPYVRPIRIRWIPVPGALSYRVLRRALPSFIGPEGEGQWGGWDRSWTVATTHADGKGPYFDDNLRDTNVDYLTSGFSAPSGLVPVTYLGPSPDDTGFPWETFGICGHAVHGIESWFLGGRRVNTATAGVTWLVPGWPGYTTFFSGAGPNGTYRDVGGGRYALIYVRGPDGAAGAGSDPEIPKQTITVNVRGIETVGDGSGTLITSSAQQYKHAMVNWVLQAYKIGNWLAYPVFEDDPTLMQLDVSSFDAAQVLSASRILGGYIGAGIIGFSGAVLSVRDLVAWFNLATDCDCGFNRRGQFFVSMINEDPGALAGLPLVDDVNHIIANSFEVNDALDAHINVIPFSYRDTYGGKQPPVLTSVEDATSIANYTSGSISGRIVSSLLEFKLVRNALTATDIVQRRLARQKNPPRIVKFLVPINVGMNLDLGDMFLLTHYGGIGSDGWIERPMRIIRHEADPEGLSVSVECFDMAYFVRSR